MRLKKLLFLSAFIFLGAGCQKSTEPAEVVTTIVPLTSVTQKILNDVVSVSSIVPTNTDPHDISLSTRELQLLTSAKTIVTWGKGLDEWVQSGIDAAADKTDVIEASSKISDELSDDPHAWLSPRKMTQVVQGLAEDFSKKFPDEQSQIQKNTDEYLKELESLDRDFQQIKTFSNRDIVTLHDAFGYLADDYGLNILGTIKDLPEDAPSPQDVAQIISALQKHPNAALFAESEINPAIIDTIARDTGRIVYILDPMETSDAEGVGIGDVYVAVMRKNLERLKTALGEK